MKNLKYTIVALLFSTVVFAQKDDNIGTEVVNVVKPYTPTISDAFKVKESPSFVDEETSKTETINYTIFSFPVASTFVPNKGKAAGVEKSAKEKLYSNYLSLAAGNYGTAAVELMVTESVSNTDYFGGMLRHLSSQGGIDEVILDDKFSNSSLDLTYGSRKKTLSWNADLGYQHQVYNWYGIPSNFFDEALINTINEKQFYHNVYAGGKLNLSDSFLKETTLKVNRFWDSYGSAENRLVAKPSMQFDLVDQKINATVVVDYLKGSFEQSFFGGNPLEYGFTNIGFQPSIRLQKDDLSVNAGVGLFYSAAQESGESKFFVYPQVTGSYKIVGDLMIAYAGIDGTLQQNSFKELVDQNFFVSPTLAIVPTDIRYDAYFGLKGKLANSVSYNVRGSYKNERNKLLFKSNGIDDDNVNLNGYVFGNSFAVVADNVKTISFFGELKADISKDISFGINGTFNSFTTDIQAEAWNLPALELNAQLDIVISPKWYAGTSLFFVGERKDQFIRSSLFIDYPFENATLKSYVDINANVGYKYNERFTFFIKGNNLANQQYQRWLNFPVQGIQVMAGASYKFDF